MILVTGATGRIGGRVVHELTEAGAPVRARFAELSPQELRAELLAGHPPAVADAMIDVLAAATGTTAPILPGVRQATGRPPHAYAEWAARNAGRFR
ncbi:NmrA family NAD(P)-binding protein [Nonomuraea sp. NPDC023979]|uniref:NmrA family NAD(P)-binding protein n=1 Tax=Nonomuraea sp. NPDC023979 TaxID=3154796 RepID=UPI0033C3FAD4